eukprot:1504435-Rhodomonas_salina.2
MAWRARSLFRSGFAAAAARVRVPAGQPAALGPTVGVTVGVGVRVRVRHLHDDHDWSLVTRDPASAAPDCNISLTLNPNLWINLKLVLTDEFRTVVPVSDALRQGGLAGQPESSAKEAEGKRQMRLLFKR